MFAKEVHLLAAVHTSKQEIRKIDQIAVHVKHKIEEEG